MRLQLGQYYGQTLEFMDVNGIVLTTSRYKKECLVPEHYHSNPYFCYVVEGSYTEYSYKNELDCTKGDILFHPGERKHYNKFHEIPGICFNLEFSSHWKEKVSLSQLELSTITRITQRNVQGVFQKIYNEFRQPDNLSTLMIESLTTEMLVLFSRNNNRKESTPYYIKRVVAYIEERYFTRLSLAELASYVNLSPEYLARAFKKSFNCSVGEYVRSIRVNHACAMLTNTDKELSQIALDTGFADQSHLTRVFKQIIGMTPLVYKRNN